MCGLACSARPSRNECPKEAADSLRLRAASWASAVRCSSKADPAISHGRSAVHTTVIITTGCLLCTTTHDNRRKEYLPRQALQRASKPEIFANIRDEHPGHVDRIGRRTRFMRQRPHRPPPYASPASCRGCRAPERTLLCRGPRQLVHLGAFGGAHSTGQSTLGLSRRRLGCGCCRRWAWHADRCRGRCRGRRKVVVVVMRSSGIDLRCCACNRCDMHARVQVSAQERGSSLAGFAAPASCTLSST